MDRQMETFMRTRTKPPHYLRLQSSLHLARTRGVWSVRSNDVCYTCRCWRNLVI